MKIIGTKFYSHDSALFVLDLNEKNIFAISTERVTRIKHDNRDPKPILEKYKSQFKDAKYICHSFCNNSLEDLRSILIYDFIYKKYKPKYIKDLKPLLEDFDSLIGKLKFSILNIYHRNVREIIKYFAYEKILKLFNKNEYELSNYLLKEYIKNLFNNFDIPIDISNIEFKDHHLCHAASTYYFSPFNDKKTLVFTLDGWGDGKYSTLWIFHKKDFRLVSQSNTNILNGRLTSIGTIYSLFTEVLGFTPNSDEGKTEALAAYGEINKELYNVLKEGYILNKRELRWEYNLKILKKL